MSYSLRRILWRVALGVSLAASASSCSSTDTGSDGVGASSSYGASSSSGGSGQTYAPPTCDQGCQDYLVAWALNDTLWFIWDQKLAGHPSGVQDIMGACPLGGTVHVTGMDAVSNGITSTQIVFQLDACESSNTQYDFTFTGSVTMDGSFNGETDFAAEVFNAPGLHVVGGLNWLDDPEIDQSCDTTETQQGGGDSFALSGRVCGRDFNEDSLKGAGNSSSGQGGSSSSGGTSSSSAGTSSNNCQCFCPDNRDCTNAKAPNPCGVDADGIPNACACPVDCK